MESLRLDISDVSDDPDKAARARKLMTDMMGRLDPPTPYSLVRSLKWATPEIDDIVRYISPPDSDRDFWKKMREAAKQYESEIN